MSSPHSEIRPTRWLSPDWFSTGVSPKAGPTAFEENWRVYGVRKVWQQLRREGFDVARCTVARLMKGMGLQGIIRGKSHRTTLADKKAPCLHWTR